MSAATSHLAGSNLKKPTEADIIESMNVDEIMHKPNLAKGYMNTFVRLLPTYQAAIDLGLLEISQRGQITAQLTVTELGKEYMATLGAL